MKFIYLLMLLKSMVLFAVTDFSPGSNNYQLAKQGLPPKLISTEKQKVVAQPTKIDIVQQQISSSVATTTIEQKVSPVHIKSTPLREVVSSPKITPIQPITKEKQELISIISVVGQGVAPVSTQSPAQAYAMAKRAATSDAYRQLAEKLKGVRINGNDTIKNMMVKRSVVRLRVRAVVQNASVIETTYKDGLCEVAMEVEFNHGIFK